MSGSTSRDGEPRDPSFGAYLRELARAPAALVSGASLPDELSPAATVAGKYRVNRRIARGGMGEVYLATDVRLDRPVALKIAWVMQGASDRIVDEARAMAQLSHPNIVEVYEVGTHDDVPYIAMEYLDGGTAATLSRGPDDWRTTLEIYRAAARGVAAAHAAGIIHGDFKPSNVLVGRDRVCVADFGLARWLGTDSVNGDVVPSTDRTSMATAIHGTTGFIPPEVYAGSPGDARSDQFALCVSMFGALYDCLPYGDSKETIRGATIAGRINPVTAGIVPAWVGRAIVRGLHPTPDRRHASIDDLLEALDPARRRRRSVALLAGAALGVGGVAAAFAPSGRSCAEAAAGAAQIWTAERAAELQAGLARVNAAHPTTPAQNISAGVQTWVDDWGRARRAACHLAQPSVIACVERGLASLQATADTLDDASRKTAVRAAQLVEQLPPPMGCLDLTAIGSGPPPPPSDQLEAVAAIRAGVAHSHAQRIAGDIDSAAEFANAAWAAAEPLGYAPAMAEAQMALARVAVSNAVMATAVQHAKLAYDHALHSKHDRLAATAAALIVARVSNVEGVDEGRRWSRAAEAAEVRAGLRPTPSSRLLRARALQAHNTKRGDDTVALLKQARAQQSLEEVSARERVELVFLVAVLLQAFDAAGSPQRFSDTLRLARDELGDDHPTVAEILHAQSAGLANLGRYDEALQAATEGVRRTRALFGDDSLNTANALTSLANAQLRHHDAPAAIESAREAARISSRPNTSSPSTEATALGYWGAGLSQLRRTDEAVARIRQAAELFAEHGFESDAANSYSKLGSAYTRDRRFDEADKALTKGIEILGDNRAHARLRAILYGNRASARSQRESLEPALADVASALKELPSDGPPTLLRVRLIGVRAGLYNERRDWPEAARWAQRAIDGFVALSGPQSPNELGALHTLALSKLELGELDASIAACQRAVKILEGLDAPDVREHAYFHLLQAMAKGRQGHRAEARTLATAAERELVTTEIDPDLLKDVREWLSDNPA